MRNRPEHRPALPDCVCLVQIQYAAVQAWDQGQPKSTAKAGEYNHDMSAYKKLAEEAMKLAKDDKLPEAYPKTKELERSSTTGPRTCMRPT